MTPLLMLGAGAVALWAMSRKKPAVETAGSYPVNGKSGQAWKVAASTPSKEGNVTYGVYLPNNTHVLTFYKAGGGAPVMLNASPSVSKSVVAKAKADFGLR